MIFNVYACIFLRMPIKSYWRRAHTHTVDVLLLVLWFCFCIMIRFPLWAQYCLVCSVILYQPSICGHLKSVRLYIVCVCVCIRTSNGYQINGVSRKKIFCIHLMYGQISWYAHDFWNMITIGYEHQYDDKKSGMMTFFTTTWENFLYPSIWFVWALSYYCPYVDRTKFFFVHIMRFDNISSGYKINGISKIKHFISIWCTVKSHGMQMIFDIRSS